MSAPAVLERDAEIVQFYGAVDLARLDVTPFVIERGRPPLSPVGLAVGVDDEGSWRTYQTCYPDGTLTSGHGSAYEAYWAAHALRHIARWATTIDLRTRRLDETSECAIERVTLLADVQRVDQRYQEDRVPPVYTTPPTLAIDTPYGGLRIGQLKNRWAILLPNGERLTGYSIPRRKRALACARQFAAIVTDWTTPLYVLGTFPALTQEIAAVRWHALSADRRVEHCLQAADDIRARNSIPKREVSHV